VFIPRKAFPASSNICGKAISEATFRCSTLGLVPIKTKLEKHSTLIRKPVNYFPKTFYNIRLRGDDGGVTKNKGGGVKFRTQWRFRI
jgi:hypothetical protein